MSVTINESKCIGCKNCINICPGNIIRQNENRKAYLKRPSDCWSCMACMKECKVNAISLILPPELEGRGGKLTIKRAGTQTEWTIEKSDGSNVTLITNTSEANQY